MKSLIQVCVIGLLLSCTASAQESPEPALRRGVSVQMAAAEHAVVIRAADEHDATGVAITADGKIFAGIAPTEVDALSRLSAETVYVKADARVPFQRVLAVLDALRGKSVVLLASSPANVDRTKMMPPYGIRLIVAR